jgi:uroporphyrin-III C-methyltransferase/precorrin-2 dehydrogenase/sirohydrochlorin ferrochelatase/precorrin-2 dehydrogenase/sirohydrochlorin ferrochelatase
MFVDITGQKCLIIGGGRVALRKVQVLLDFGAQVVVVAKEISEEIRKLVQNDDGSATGLFLYEKEFEDKDIEGAALVVVATNNNELNARISGLCNNAGVPVNVVDDKEKCSFIFPSYVKEGDLVGAFSSGGNSPVLAKYLKDKTTDFLTSDLGQLNEQLGKWRPLVIERISGESGRKTVFERILEDFLETGNVPQDDEIEEIISDTTTFRHKNF